jgi:RNA polymerase sigma-70 factor (ECF subfamily)
MLSPDRFRHAYHELRPLALSIARSILHDDEAAEDVVQDVFLQLWQRPGAYDAARGSLRTYVAMLTRSRSVDRWRSAAAHDAAVRRAWSQLERLPDAAESCADPVIRRERRAQALAALRTVPPEQRSAVMLTCIGLTATEIARTEDLPLGTAKSRVRLGIEKARARLEDAA